MWLQLSKEEELVGIIPFFNSPFSVILVWFCFGLGFFGCCYLVFN